jgi:BirA family transcriptional regulator, biotin operon repressor / biotin---[acetyl-CoA-carboxylase] ligase
MVEGAREVRIASVTSTQEVARELPIGSIVVADHQTAGRGRLDREWQAPPYTALLASFVLARHPLMSLAAGVAAAEACGPDVRLKWPNDLMLRDRKLGGILVEVAGERAIVGIGINLTWAPAGAARLDRPRDEVLDALRSALAGWTSAPNAKVLERWRQLSDTIGRRVRVELPQRSFEGVAKDVAEDGSLVVDGETVSAGDVIHLTQPGHGG